MAIITPGGALGQSALALGISPGVVQNLFNVGALESFVQGRIAQRNLASAQQSFQTNFSFSENNFCIGQDENQSVSFDFSIAQLPLGF